MKNNSIYRCLTSVCLSISKLVDNTDMPHIQMTEVPAAYFS
jgi:hypothetical protein